MCVIVRLRLATRVTDARDDEANAREARGTRGSSNYGARVLRARTANELQLSQDQFRISAAGQRIILYTIDTRRKRVLHVEYILYMCFKR